MHISWISCEICTDVHWRSLIGVAIRHKNGVPLRSVICWFCVLQSFHKKHSTLAGSIVRSTSHMSLFGNATLSILVRRSRKSLKRDKSTIPGDAQRSRGTVSWGTWDLWNKLSGTADAAPDFGVRGRSIAEMAPECRPRSHVVGTIAQAGKLLPQ